MFEVDIGISRSGSQCLRWILRISTGESRFLRWILVFLEVVLNI